MQIDKTIHAEIAVSYSSARKAEMKMYGEKDCSALFSFVQDIIQRHMGSIEKVIVPKGDDRQIDFLVKIKTHDNISLQEINRELQQIRSGVSKITLFPLAD